MQLPILKKVEQQKKMTTNSITVESLKKAIFDSGNINIDWENDELGTLHQIQAEGEFILSDLLTSSDLNLRQSFELMTALMEYYACDYPLCFNNES